MEDNFENIIKTLEEGKVILYPTDTIWGLGCDAHNLEAIHKVYDIKKREKDKPLIVLVSDIEMLKKYVNDIHPRIETLLLYHNRPLTLIYKGGINLPDILMKNGSIAIRIIKDNVIANLIKEFGKPIVSTSANIAGHPFEGSYEDIEQVVKNSVHYIFKYGRNNSVGSQPSVIATFNKNGKLKFLR